MSRIISGNLIWQGKQEGPEWDESGLRTQRPRPAFSSLSLSLPGSIPIAINPLPNSNHHQ